MSRKVVVIGGGLAGTAAAAFVKRTGGEATIVSNGHGATSFSSGAIDLAGDPGPAPERFETACREVRKNIERILAERPEHPYSILTKSSERPVEDLLSIFQEAFLILFPATGGVELAGDPELNSPCFTALGTVKLTALYPISTATIDSPGIERPLALGVRGLPDFEPAAWAKVAADMGERLDKPIEASAGWIDFADSRERLSPELAAAILRDTDGFVDAVAKAASDVSGATCLVLPPVLPASGRAELISRIGEASDMPVYETLSMPPSVPGLRLVRHLSNRALEMEVETVRGEVVGFEAEGERVKALIVSGAGGESRIEAGAIVLATGKFLGGGLKKDRAFEETVFGLPVFMGDKVPAEIFIQKTVGLHVNDRHALFETGIKTDAKLRPIDARGRAPFNNLFAAGSILAGANYLTDADGAGV